MRLTFSVCHEKLVMRATVYSYFDICFSIYVKNWFIRVSPILISHLRNSQTWAQSLSLNVSYMGSYLLLDIYKPKCEAITLLEEQSIIYDSRFLAECF